MSENNSNKESPKKVDWNNNPKVTMDIKKSDDGGWTPNSRVIHKLKESQDEESK